MLQTVFSQCIRDFRHKAGIAQEDLAHAAGVDRGYMSKLERGKHAPTLDMIYRLLPPLGITFIQFAVAFELAERRHRKTALRNGKH